LEAIDGVIVEAQVEDMQGRFNLNSLIDMDGKSDPAAREVLERLLQVLEIEPQIAARMTDWIDADDEAQPGGAEESVYSALPVPYRPPNRPVTSISELLLLDGMDAERYARLAPHVAALPRDAAINLCSATGVLLDALTGERQWTRDPQGLERNRQRSCFPGRDAFRNSIGNPQAFERLERSVGLGERSMYFRVRTLASVGTAQFSLYSLLRHEGTTPGEPRLRVMQRQFSE
jgi:general secretion pathway protein K